MGVWNNLSAPEAAFTSSALHNTHLEVSQWHTLHRGSSISERQGDKETLSKHGYPDMHRKRCDKDCKDVERRVTDL